MKITLKLFSVAKDLAGFEERDVLVGHEATAGEVLRYLATINPSFQRWRESLRLAVNLQYVNEDHLLREGDEVAVIPPVSGG
jgi:molybdopterin converting factor subunit 1